jgi:pimeloyl-ACP methyl ester carboxylesterase
MLPVILKALAATIPGAETAMIPNAGHSMFTQNPTAFCEAVLDFLGR